MLDFLGRMISKYTHWGMVECGLYFFLNSVDQIVYTNCLLAGSSEINMSF